MRQVELNFEPGLTQQFPKWGDCLRASVYGCGRQFKAVAADLDMSVSELSRKLADNPADNVNFPLDRLDELLTATGDMRLVYWLVERFVDTANQRQQAIAELNAVLPRIRQALVTLDDDGPPGPKIVA